jgi:PHD/YefM family antitoxin component YafN of YafNO toxin-antitoxin module
MQSLRAQGALLVTNHDQPEAVILSADVYASLLERAAQAESRVESDLTQLRQRFDERLPRSVRQTPANTCVPL